MQMSRDERQALVIENWKKVNCRGVFEGTTGFGGWNKLKYENKFNFILVI